MATDFSLYKVDLDTPQPGGRKGESPRAAFTKYNDALDSIAALLDEAGEAGTQAEISSLRARLSGVVANSRTLALDFVSNTYSVLDGMWRKRKQLSDIIAVTRASGATRINESGLIELVAEDEPRIDYDPVTLACRGLLIEEQRTNLFTYSEQFDQWGKTNISVSSDAIEAPDGTLSADKVIATSGTALHYLASVDYVEAGVSAVASVYAKAGGYDTIILSAAGSDEMAAYFRLAGAGSVESVVGGTARITRMRDGWYRCEFAGVAPWYQFRPYVHVHRYDEYDGDGVSGVYLWGAQLEVGEFSTSYIPTESSQVTRAADAVSINDVIPWLNLEEGTIFVEAESEPGEDSCFVNFFTPLTSARLRIMHYVGHANGLIQNQDGEYSSVSIDGTSSRLALAYKPGESAFAAGGVVDAFEPVHPMPAISNVELGSSHVDGGVRGRMHIKRVAYYPWRLPDAELQSLTA